MSLFIRRNRADEKHLSGRFCAVCRNLSPLFVLGAYFAVLLSAHRLIGLLFQYWNLNSETLAYAPRWAQHIADASGEISSLAALLAGALTALLFCRKSAFCGRIRGKTACIAVCAGLVSACVLTGALLLSGSIRLPAFRSAVTLKAFMEIGMDLAGLALLAWTIRPYIGRIFGKARFRAAKTLACAASGALQSLLVCALSGQFQLFLFLNAFLAGALMYHLFEKYNNAAYELILLVPFRLTVSRAFGYPGWLNGAYPVSEDLLTGAQNGLEGSLLVLICLLLLMIYPTLEKVCRIRSCKRKGS